jgi:REP element-mobilizing transposase RayT
MARLARNENSAGIWHVYARGVEKRPIFMDDADRELYERLLIGNIEAFGWHLLGYCLMPNHVHLIIETTKPNLGKGMHRLHGVYAQAFNVRHKRVGHLFQSRYGSRAIRDEAELARVFAYVAVNPVAAWLCADPEAWRWSGYAETIGRVSGRRRLVNVARLARHLEPFGPAPAIFRRLVSDRLLSRGLPAPG